MAQERKTLVDRIQRWRLVTDNLRPDLERFPQLEGSVADLEEMCAEAAEPSRWTAVRRPFAS